MTKIVARNCKFCQKAFDALFGNVKQGKGQYCSKTCSNRGNGLKFAKGHRCYLTPEIYKENGLKISKAKKGKKFSEAHRQALSVAQLKYRDKIGRKKCRSRIRKCVKCYVWRALVFKRDNWICQDCGQRGGLLEAHHIKGWAKYPKLRHRLSNGQTLCKECHKKTPNYKGRKQ